MRKIPSQRAQRFVFPESRLSNIILLCSYRRKTFLDSQDFVTHKYAIHAH